jgi:thiol-disulfide isomerase/thioredoxin
MKKITLIILILLFSFATFAQSDKKDAPKFDVTSIDGTNFKLEDLKGKIVVVNIWGIWCPPCLREIPSLNQFATQYKNNANVVFIAFTEDNEAKLAKFLKSKPFKYNIIPKSSETIKSFSANMIFPTHYLINQDGKIEVVAAGTSGLMKVKSKLKNLLIIK